MEVIHLEPSSIIEHWNLIEPAIQKSLKHGVNESTTYDYLRWLQDPTQYQCWVVINEEKVTVNVSVTKINHYANHKALHLITTTSTNGGKWDAYKHAHHVIEDYARQQGCRRIEMYGRKGWSKILNKLKGSQGESYNETYVVHSMELENEI
jgi:hypothetical protein